MKTEIPALFCFLNNFLNITIEYGWMIEAGVSIFFGHNRLMIFQWTNYEYFNYDSPFVISTYKSETISISSV